ncbi:MAG: hypothetical protein M4579_006270 [Chaenotheca gracillima]|nr:MAG: hypothetical protein M4579_006270 [Chaenotheca gracillima]
MVVAQRAASGLCFRCRRSPPHLRTRTLTPRNSLSTTATSHAPASPRLPRVAQPAFWTSLIPKPFRRSSDPTQKKRTGWNPATFYIAIFLLIGSQSIHTITVRKEFEAFSRRTEARIGILKEAVERTEKGEEGIDVEKLLGRGDEDAERGWEDVLKEIQEEEEMFQKAKRERDSAATREVPEAENGREYIEVQDPASRKKENLEGYY